ncbi:FAD-dependent monooxygenase [Streptomyces tauricus]|uniref:FAD-dependent monooxygenase n=1 Tax=Streptomyces tauricus TaxID=68274 RepID=UPI0038B573F9
MTPHVWSGDIPSSSFCRLVVGRLASGGTACVVAPCERLSTDVLVIGGGPAGLAVAAGLQDTGVERLVVEQGPALATRSDDEAAHLVTGVGGAGLFSDGKFSFYPSATGLWALRPVDDLRLAYDSMAKNLAPTGLSVPSFPKRSPEALQPLEFRVKQYPSSYVSMEGRMHLTEQLVDAVGAGNLLIGTRAVRASGGPAGSIIVSLKPTSPQDGDGRRVTVHCKALVLAGGRFGPLSCAVELKGFRQAFRRLEMGVRIEQPADNFFLRDQRALDPKLLWEDVSGRYSWRTFCCCRNGRVMATDFNGWVTLSGRADCPPTGKSNVGFNLRISNERQAAQLWHEASLLSVKPPPSSWTPLVDFIATNESSPRRTLHHRLGRRGAALVAEGLCRLTDRVGTHQLADALVAGPTLEGVGHYPLTGPDLKTSEYPVWTVGDTTGRFRGITAALVSGFFAAQRLRKHFRR